MARQIGKLSALAVSRLKEEGIYSDGGNLNLQISGSGAKSWLFRYMREGKARSMGLGALHTVTLAEARVKATECRKLLSMNIDPIESRKAGQAKARLAAARDMTFEQCGAAYIEAHKASWRNVKHADQWNNTLKMYAYPIIGKLSVQDVDVGLILKVLEPIWQIKTETANRVRGRMESILDWATAREYRQGDNPALWRGRLENLLPKRTKIQKVEHHPALPYSEISEFMEKLAIQPGLSTFALQLLILTATRTSEVIGARWEEFDLKEKLWVIPATRIKNGKEHRIPLSESALFILNIMNGHKSNNFVFPSNKKDKPLSNMAMLTLLKRMKRTDITVHGFRSTFRDWAAEQTNYPREVAEAALSHVVKDKVEAAYRRGDMLQKRQQLMEAWARYCQQPKVRGIVVGMNDKKNAL